MTGLIALGVGLSGAGHCALMCGGIASAIGSRANGGRAGVLRRTFAFNLARLTSYAVIGGSLATGVGTLIPYSSLVNTARFAQGLAAITLFALAARLLIEGEFTIGTWLQKAFWRASRPILGRALMLPRSIRPIALGLLWGLMPCGLLYWMLLVASATGSAVAGATILISFGLGTLPAMIGFTLVGGSIKLAAVRPRVRQVAGVLAICAGLWAAAPLGHQEAMLHHPNGTHPVSTP